MDFIVCYDTSFRKKKIQSEDCPKIHFSNANNIFEASMTYMWYEYDGDGDDDTI